LDQKDILHAARKAKVAGYMGCYQKDWIDDFGRVVPPYGKYAFTSYGYAHVGETPRKDQPNYHKVSPTKFGTGKFPSTPAGVVAQQEARERERRNSSVFGPSGGRKPTFANGVTVHNGEGWEPKALQTGITDPGMIAMLEDHCSQIRCPGVLETTWRAYKSYKQPEHDKDHEGHKVSWSPQTIPSHYIADARSITKTSYPGYRDVPFKRAAPMSDPFASSMPSSTNGKFTPMWKGCEMRCPLDETLNNGKRPDCINNGFAPQKPGHSKAKAIPPKRQSDLPKSMGAPQQEGTIVKIGGSSNGTRSSNSFVHPAA